MSEEKDTVIVIMAGGLGKRMESDLPKVLHKINNVPMIVKILWTIKELEKNPMYNLINLFNFRILPNKPASSGITVINKKNG